MTFAPHTHTAFDIRQWLDFDRSGRAACPACIQDNKLNQKNLSVDLSTGAYRCWRGCTPEQIRAALGNPKSTVPTHSKTPASRSSQQKPRTVSRTDVLLSEQRLLNHNDKPQQQARHWLEQRGFTQELIRFYHLGLERWQRDGEHYWSISIHVPANVEDQFYRKLRIAPWLNHPDCPKWSQAGVPATIFHTYLPDDAEATWFCEGEWDAMRLGWLAHQQKAKVAVCCSTAGCGTVPPKDQLNELPGEVIIFFDRNDTPTKNGTIPGDEGAKKLAQVLNGRGRIAQVPMPEDCTINGWDVSDAIAHGYTWSDFETAANQSVRQHLPSSGMQSVEDILRNLLETHQSPFARELALLNKAKEMGTSFQNLNQLAKSLSQELETEADQVQTVEKLRNLIQTRPRPFNLNHFLEPWFANILIQTANAMPTAPEFLFTTLLPAAASQIGTAAQIVIKPSAKYTQPMLFWTAIVAQSGSMKTPAQRIILDPLITLEKEQHEIYQLELEEYERKKAAGESAKKPIRKRYVTKDSTIETLQRIHSENTRGLLYYRDELVGGFKARNAYRGGYGADEETELDQWTGSAIVVDRAERSVCIPKSSVCRTGGIQNDILEKCKGNHQDSNGSWSRWLFCAAQAPPRYLNLQSDEPDTHITETLTWLYHQLERLPKQDYFLTTEAKVLFEAWQHQLVDTQRDEESSGLQGVYPKIEAYTARLALWLHIVNSVLRRECPTHLITEATMEQAIELAAYYLWQHRMIHTQGSPDSGLTAIALKIQKFAERVGEVSASRIKSGIRDLRNMATTQIRQIMESLAQTGFGQVRGEGGTMTYIPGAEQTSSVSSDETIDSIDPTMTARSIDEIQIPSEITATDDTIDHVPVSPSSETEVPIRSFNRGDAVEVWFQNRWQLATYLRSMSHSVISRITQKLDDGHQVSLPHQVYPYAVATTDLRPISQST